MKLLMEGWRDYLGLGKEAEPEEVPEEEEDEQSSMEANLAMLLMRDEADQATMMFDMLGDQLDLDLLATELDDRLRAEWEKVPPRPPGTFNPTSIEWREYYNSAADDWIPKLESVIKFVTGGDSTQGFRPSAQVYKLGSLKGVFARHLKMTTHAMKGSDESLMENWRQYLKDNNLDKLPLGAAPGSYKFKSPEEMEEYTRWNNPGKVHDLGITWEDLLHALFSGRGRKLADYADESAEDWERRRAEEESDETPT